MTSTQTTEPSTTTSDPQMVQVQRIYIKARPQAIWDAITKPEWTEKYGYGGRAEFDLRPGGAFRTIASKEMQDAGMPEVVVEGQVLESDPPNKLVQTWRAGWDNEPATTLTYVIKEGVNGTCSLTVTHDLTGAPNTLAMVAGSIDGAGGGWAEVLSDLKSLLETGTGMYGTDRYTAGA